MRNLLYIAVLALPMLVCFGSPSTAAPRARSYIPQLGRTFIACRDVPGDILATASSQPTINAWPPHPAPSHIAV